MEDRQFKALISLLDDDDPEVMEHVWSQLLSMGTEGMQRLEAEWEIQEDPVIQRKLEDVIQRISLHSVSHDLLAWRKSGGKDLLEGWMNVTRIQYPDLDLKPLKNEINRLVNKIWLELNNQMESWDKIRVINHVLFVMEGYGPNKKDLNHPNNNFLNHVLEQKEGNAISLSMLYHIIAMKLDMPVFGVILPGYYVLMFIDEDREFFIDVFNGGRTFSQKDLKRFLKEMQVDEKSSFFKPTSHTYTILTLITNLESDYKRQGNAEKSEDIGQLLKDIDISFE